MLFRLRTQDNLVVLRKLVQVQSSGRPLRGMKTNTAFTVCLWVPLLCPGVGAELMNFSLRDLLNPQLNLEITLRVPEYYYSKASSLPLALTVAMDLLISKQAPFRLFYNFTQRKLQISPPPTRHSRNEKLWLIFVALQNKSQVLQLHQVLSSCSLGHGSLLGVVHNDLIQLVVDESAASESWGGRYRLVVARTYVPLYFLIIIWSLGLFTPNALLVQKACVYYECDRTHLGVLNNFLLTLREPRGLDEIFTRIRAKKKDLQGSKVYIVPNRQVYGTWESTWKPFVMHFSLRTAQISWKHAFGGLFQALVSAVNFTLDSVRWSTGLVPDANKNLVHMDIAAICNGTLNECYLYPLSLSVFEHYKTFVFTQPVQPAPYTLRSLRAPFSDPVATILLLFTSAVAAVTLVILLKVKSCKAFRAPLAIFAGLVGKSLNMSSNPRSLIFYACWLLVTGFISMTYTNILHSFVVVPGIRYSSLSFDDMIRHNYAFEALNWQWMKRVKRLSGCEGCTSAREKILSERVGNLTHKLQFLELVEHYSDTTKTTLVDTSSSKHLFKIIAQATGRDVVVGKESFFNMPLWWAFRNVERAPLWAKSVESLTEAGLIDYFLQLSDAKRRELVEEGSHQELTAEASGDPSLANTHRSSKAVGISLRDSLISECFVLFLYGNIVATFVFVLEQLTSVFLLLVRALRK